MSPDEKLAAIIKSLEINTENFKSTANVFDQLGARKTNSLSGEMTAETKAACIILAKKSVIAIQDALEELDQDDVHYVSRLLKEEIRDVLLWKGFEIANQDHDLSMAWCSTIETLVSKASHLFSNGYAAKVHEEGIREYDNDFNALCTIAGVISEKLKELGQGRQHAGGGHHDDGGHLE